MPQLSIDADDALVQRGELRSTARLRKFFASLTEGNEWTFEHFWNTGRTLTFSRVDGEVQASPAHLSSLISGDRLILLLDRFARRRFRHHDGAALLVEHILRCSDPAFLQGLDVEIPAALDSELHTLDDIGPKRQRQLLEALVSRMVRCQLFTWPAARGLASVVRRNEPGMRCHIDSLDTDDRDVETLDAKARNALERFLVALPPGYAGQDWGAIGEALGSLARFFEAGAPLPEGASAGL